MVLWIHGSDKYSDGRLVLWSVRGLEWVFSSLCRYLFFSLDQIQALLIWCFLVLVDLVDFVCGNYGGKLLLGGMASWFCVCVCVFIFIYFLFLNNSCGYLKGLLWIFFFFLDGEFVSRGCGGCHDCGGWLWLIVMNFCVCDYYFNECLYFFNRWCGKRWDVGFIV